MSLQLARDTYRGIRSKNIKRKRSINVDEHNDALARERGYSRRNLSRIASEYEEPLKDEQPYFTVLTSPIGIDCE